MSRQNGGAGVHALALPTVLTFFMEVGSFNVYMLRMQLV